MDKISLGYNAVPANAKKLILEVLASGQFSPGPKVREFEEKFAKLHKAKYAVFVNSGTDALRLSLLAMKERYNWKDGDHVIVPALTFVATVNVILQAGLKPFFVDVGMYDYLISPWNMEARLGGKPHEDIVAIAPVHLFGQSCSEDVFDLAKKYKLKVLEDSCETILNPIRGDVSCHSTYMAHHVTTGVGGMALTNDFSLSWQIRSFANHGRDPMYIPGEHGMRQAKGKELLKRRFRFDRIGYSCRGTEFEAALGLSQIETLESNVLDRQLVASLLYEALKKFDELCLPLAKQTHTFMMFPIHLREGTKIDKYDLCLHLEKNGIETRDMMPIVNQPCYKDIVKENGFPVAERINKDGFYIACHPGMTKENILHIQNVFSAFFAKRKTRLVAI